MEWECLTPTDGGTDLPLRVAEVVRGNGRGGLVLVGHHPRLSQMLEEMRIIRNAVEIDQGRGIWFEAGWKGGKVAAAGPIAALETGDMHQKGDAIGKRNVQNLSLIADLAEGLDTLAQLEAKHPVMGARVRNFTVEIKRVCEVAYDHLLKTLNKIAILSSAPELAAQAGLFVEAALDAEEERGGGAIVGR